MRTVSDQPEPSHKQRLAKALEESRRVEKEMNAQDVAEDAQFADRLASRLERESDA